MCIILESEVMPRTEKNRIVGEPPLFSAFKPIGVKGPALSKIMLTLDEYEALKLADDMGLSHAEAADEMEISRSTFTRLIDRARKKMADFIIHGKMLVIEGGNIHFRNNILRCMECGQMFKTGFDEHLTNCPACNSDKLINFAGGFGHGKCCKTNK